MGAGTSAEEFFLKSINQRCAYSSVSRWNGELD